MVEKRGSVDVVPEQTPGCAGAAFLSAAHAYEMKLIENYGF